MPSYWRRIHGSRRQRRRVWSPSAGGGSTSGMKKGTWRRRGKNSTRKRLG